MMEELYDDFGAEEGRSALEDEQYAHDMAAALPVLKGTK